MGEESTEAKAPVSSRHLPLWIGGALVLLVGVVAAGYFVYHDDGPGKATDAGPADRSTSAGSAPQRSASSSSSMTTVQGAGAQAVAGALAARWGTAGKRTPLGHYEMTPKRPSGGEMYIFVGPEPNSDEISTMKCLVRAKAVKSDPAALTDAETCLTPLLTDADRDATLARVAAAEKPMTVPSRVNVKFDRFTVSLSYLTADNFSLGILGPGRIEP